jgi:hypothetical protein
MINDIRSKYAKTNLESIMNSCSRQFDDYILRASLFSISKFRNKAMTGLTQDLVKLDLSFIINEAETLEASSCFAINESDIKTKSEMEQIQGEEFLAARNLFLAAKEDLIRALRFGLD